MRISRKTRYGLRMMLELALEYGKGYIFIKEVALKQGISEKYLSQIALALKSRGLVASSRGARGGHMLGRPPDKITVRDVVEALEGDRGIVECVDNPSVCRRYGACVAAEFWSRLGETVSDALEAETLGDLLKESGMGGMGNSDYVI